MKTLYAVEWVEVEYGWGSRPEGFKLFDNLDDCIKLTKESSEKGIINLEVVILVQKDL